MQALVLGLNGRLLYASLDEGDGNGHARHVSRDVTRQAHQYLFEPVVFGPGVRLLDLFWVLSLCEPLRDCYQRQFAHELLQEVSEGEPTPYVRQYDPDGIEYLELRQQWRFNSNTGRYLPKQRLALKAVGYALRGVDCLDSRRRGHKPGDRADYCVSTISPLALVDVPIRIDPSVQVCEADVTSSKFGTVLNVSQNPGVLLGQVFESVLGELSLFGVAADRDAARAEVAAICGWRDTVTPLRDLTTA